MGQLQHNSLHDFVRSMSSITRGYTYWARSRRSSVMTYDIPEVVSKLRHISWQSVSSGPAAQLYAES